MLPAKPRIPAIALACLLLLSACATHNPLSTTAQSALQKTIITNAAVVKANNAVEKAVEDAVVAKVITPDQARPMITGCLKIAQTSEAVREITSKGTEASWSVDGPKIRALLTASPLQLSPSTSSAIDLLIATANSSIALLIQTVQGVK